MLSQHVEVVSGRTHGYCYGALNQLQCSGSRTTRRLFLILQTSRLHRTLISALTYTGPNAADTSGYSSHTSLLSALGLYLLNTFLFSAVFAPHFSVLPILRKKDRSAPEERSGPSQVRWYQGLAGWGCFPTIARMESTRRGPVPSPRLVRDTYS